MSVEPATISRSDRLVEPLAAPSWIALLRLAAIFSFCLSLNLAIFIGFFREAFFESGNGVTMLETPVEVIAEPPQEPPAPFPALPPPPPLPPLAQPEPEPPKIKPKIQADLDVKIATDAPRDGGQEKTEKEQLNAADAKLQAPRRSEPEKQAALAPEKSKDAVTDKDMNLRMDPPSAELPTDKADAEIIENLKPNDKAPAQQKNDGEPKDKAQKGEKLRKDLAAAFENTPEFHIAPPSRPSPTSRGPGRASIVSGGNADPSYITILYGLILKKFTQPAVLSHPRKTNTVVAFVINPNGVLVETELLQTGGAPELDAAVISAIRRASPFPPTPNSQTLGFIYSGPDK